MKLYALETAERERSTHTRKKEKIKKKRNACFFQPPVRILYVYASFEELR